MCSTLAIFLRAPSILDSVLSMSCPRSSSMTDCSSSSLPICLLMTLRLPTDFWMPSSSSSWLTISSCCCLWVVSSRRRMGLSTSFLRLVYLAVREGLNSSILEGLIFLFFDLLSSTFSFIHDYTLQY
uniref:Putative secreted protein n=1 Tax=Ixodes ricinus TaxID=34613 RepID=A0A6B0UPV3_IXORI